MWWNCPVLPRYSVCTSWFEILPQRSHNSFVECLDAIFCSWLIPGWDLTMVQSLSTSSWTFSMLTDPEIVSPLAISSTSLKPRTRDEEIFECCLIELHVVRIGWWKSSYEWWPPARLPVHWRMMGTLGLVAAIQTTCRIPSTEPGLNGACLMPACLNPSMISTAFSVLGMPTATQKPSIGSLLAHLLSQGQLD